MHPGVGDFNKWDVMSLRPLMGQNGGSAALNLEFRGLDGSPCLADNGPTSWRLILVFRHRYGYGFANSP